MCYYYYYSLFQVLMQARHNNNNNNTFLLDTNSTKKQYGGLLTVKCVPKLVLPKRTEHILCFSINVPKRTEHILCFSINVHWLNPSLSCPASQPVSWLCLIATLCCQWSAAVTKWTQSDRQHISDKPVNKEDNQSISWSIWDISIQLQHAN